MSRSSPSRRYSGCGCHLHRDVEVAGVAAVAVPRCLCRGTRMRAPSARPAGTLHGAPTRRASTARLAARLARTRDCCWRPDRRSPAHGFENTMWPRADAHRARALATQARAGAHVGVSRPCAVARAAVFAARHGDGAQRAADRLVKRERQRVMEVDAALRRRVRCCAARR